MSVRLLRWVMALAALLGSLQATAAIKDQAADGFTIEHSQWVPVDQATAWKAFVHDVGKWWPADHTWWGDASKLSISEQVGGCFCELNGAQQARHMGVAFVDPGKLMRMTGGLGPLQGMGLDGVMEWRFVAENDGTRITLWYRAGGYTPDDLTSFVPVVDKVQGQQLAGLAEYLRKQSGASN